MLNSYYYFSKSRRRAGAFGAIGIAMAPAAWKCICCKGKSGNPRANANSKRCTASQCVKALTALRNQEKELRQQQSPGVPHTESDIIPHDMAVVTITEILGERCFRPADMAAKRRRCGPRGTTVLADRNTSCAVSLTATMTKKARTVRTTRTRCTNRIRTESP